MTEIVEKTDEWDKLVNDCKTIMAKANKKTRREILEGHYLLGQRITEYSKKVTDVGTPLNEVELANALEIKQQRISEIIAFVEWIGNKYGSFDAFLKFYEDRTELPPWTEITHYYLPFAKTPQLEDSTLKTVEIPQYRFSTEEEARSYFERKNGTYEGIVSFYKGKLTKQQIRDLLLPKRE